MPNLPARDEKAAVFAPGVAAPPAQPLFSAEKQQLVEELRYVAAEALNLRAGPDSGARRLGSLPRHARLRVRAAQAGWLLVAAPDGTEGWVSARFTTATAPVASTRNAPSSIARPSTAPPSTTPSPAAPGRTRDAVTAEIIAESIRQYPGPCPCPYSVSKSGKCGKRSAWSKPGGRSPFCFPDDIPKAMIEARR